MLPVESLEYLGYAGRRVLAYRKWSGKILADHHAGGRLGVLVTHPADDQPGADLQRLLLGGEGRVLGLGDFRVRGPAA